MILPQPIEGVMDIPFYRGGKSHLSDRKLVTKLSSNEGALGPSPNAVLAYERSASALSQYPDGSAMVLKEAIAEVNSIDVKNIICGAGSDEILCLICRAFAGQGDEIIHTSHGFLMYSIYARSVGATPISVPEEHLRADVDSIISCVSPSTKIVFLANPNNPTGTMLPVSEIYRLRAGLRDDILLVIDGAYAEYLSADFNLGLLDIVHKFPNMIMTRTFSKIHSLASLRVGWAFGAERLIQILERLRSPFNINSAAIAAAAASMRDVQHIHNAKIHNDTCRQRIINELQSLGLEVLASSGNFVLPKFSGEPGRTAADADKHFLKSGIIVRRVENYGLPMHLRITIGTNEQMERVLISLGDFVDGSCG